MKKNRLLLSVLAILFFVAPLKSAAQDENWYKSFDGTIGKYPIVIHLHKMGHALAGYYYYKSREQPIYFTGNDTTPGRGKFSLYGYYPADILTLSLSNGKCTGEWESVPPDAANKTTLPVNAVEKYINPSLRFDLVLARATKDLRPGLKESPYGSFEIASVWPRGQSTPVSYVKKALGTTLMVDKNTQTLGADFREKTDEYLKAYLEENKNVPDSELVEYPFTFNVESEQWVQIVYHSAKLLVLADWNYNFMGGAHGNHTTRFVNLDLVSGKELRLDDVVAAAGRKKLQPLLEKYFRIQNGLGPTDNLTDAGLFENELKPGENFYVTRKGIGFAYAPYDVGPYALGEVIVFIPFKEMTTYLQPGFKKLIQ